MTIGADTITIYSGEDVLLSFTMDPIVDITGWSIEFNIESATGRITKTATVVSGPDGTFKVTLADTDTATLRTGHLSYDVWRTDANNEEVLARGVLVVKDPARDPGAD